jgi:uncharacterized protein (TIGR00730 family)
MKINKVTLFCGSRYGKNPLFKENAEQLGKILANAGVALVFGGGRFGTMGTVAKAVLQNGGTIIPVSTESVWELESNQMFESEFTGKVFDYTDKVQPIMAPDIVERKRIMRDMGDACFILPGSLGTFDELFEVLCLAYLKEYNKPCIILDTDNYWQGLKQLCDKAIESKFARPMIKSLFTFVDSVDDMLPAAESYYDEQSRKVVSA